MKSIEYFENQYQGESDPLAYKKAYKAYLRVELSAMAMQGILTAVDMVDPNAIAIQAIEVADELIKELKI